MEAIMEEPTTGVDWENEVTELLNQLSTVQDELLEVLVLKRNAMAAGHLDELTSLQSREEELAQRLESCHHHRGVLLQKAGRHGLPSDSITQLADSMQAEDRSGLSDRMQHVGARTRLLRHHSLTNWVLAQRSLLHLSQLLEILATGGQIKPTYSKEESSHGRGALVDRAA